MRDYNHGTEHIARLPYVAKIITFLRTSFQRDMRPRGAESCISVAADTAVSLPLARLHHVTFYLLCLPDLHSSYPSHALCQVSMDASLLSFKRDRDP
jgi:hypothetical protein